MRRCCSGQGPVRYARVSWLIISICVSLRLSIYPSVCPSTYPSIYLSMCMSMSVSLSVCLCVCLSGYLFTATRSFSADFRLPLESLSVASEIETVCVLRQLCTVLRNQSSSPFLLPSLAALSPALLLIAQAPIRPRRAARVLGVLTPGTRSTQGSASVQALPPALVD